MLTLASTTGLLFYLIPLLCVFVLRSREDRPLWEVALDIPLTVAIDLLTLLLFCRLVRLDVAVVASRVLWASGSVAWAVRRWRDGWRPRKPGFLGLREGAVVLLGALVGLAISLSLSRPCAVWDRQWHIPLVTSLRGQTIPFMNVYERHGGLYYHFSGNALAGALQTLSSGVVHSSLALSIAHDLLFSLTGATLGLLLLSLGVRAGWMVALLVAAVLLVGPATLLREGEVRPGTGYSLTNFLTLSFRPHVALGALMITGFVGSVLVRGRGDQGRPVDVRKTLPPLLGTTAMLALTDEASIGLLGLSLGVTWLFFPDVVHPDRKRGVLVFVGLAAALLIPMLVMVGSVAPGAPKQLLGVVPWRSPGYYQPAIPFSQPNGLRMLLIDMAAPLSVTVAGWLVLVRVRVRRREAYPLIVFWTVLSVVSFLLMSRVDINHSGLEVHRFSTAAMYLAPLFGTLWVTLLNRELGPVRGAGSLAAVVVYFGVSAADLSTIEWLQGMAVAQCTSRQGFWGQDKFYQTNCRKMTGATLFQKTKPTYIEEPLWYLYGGCHPLWAPGPRNSEANHAVKVGAPRLGLDALAELHKDMLKPDETLTVICQPATVPTKDPVCQRARALPTCAPMGKRGVACQLSAADRQQILGK